MKVNTEFKQVKYIGKMPKEWEFETFSDISKVRQGLQIPIDRRFKEYEYGRYVYITVQYLRNVSNKYNTYYIENPSKNVICSKDDILMTRTGNTGEIITNVNGVFHNNFFLIDYNDNKLNKEYLIYYLKSYFIQNLISIYAGATTIPDLNHGDFYNIPIVYPKNIKEQEKIAQILSNVDMNIEKTEQAIAKYKQIKKGLMDDLLTGKVRIKDGKRFRETNFKDVKDVGKIPWDWEVKELGKICNYIGRGKSPVYSEIPIYMVINQSCIQWGYIKSDNMKYVTKKFFNSLSEERLVKQGDILINSTGTGTLGRVVYYDKCEKIAYDSHVTKISIENGDSLYYSYYFSYHKFQNVIESFCVTGSTNQIELQKSELEKRYIPVFNKKEQSEISIILKKQDILIDKEKKNLEKLKKLKSGIMEDLLTGKVRVNID